MIYETKLQTVCAETIYNYIYNSRKGRKYQLWTLLPRQKPRRSKWRYRKSKSRIKHRVSIHKRPDHINKRLYQGDWEVDLVMFGRHKHNLITLIDRKTRYLIIINNPEGKNSTNVINKIKEKTMQYTMNTMAFDNGAEFSQHHLLSQNNVATYFCDPYSSWQKGSVEHANGIIRRFLPKGYDPTNLTDKMVENIQNKINNMPRKILGYQKPTELTNCRTSS